MSEVKEPNYFTTMPLPKRHKIVHQTINNEDDYLSLFKSANKAHLYAGEATVRYLSDSGAIKNISAKSPDSKLIAILRNPIDRAYSAYLVRERSGTNQANFYNTMRDHIEKYNNNIVTETNFAKQGKYIEQLEEVYQSFDSDQVLVLSFKDLKNDPSLVTKQLSSFLEVENNFKIDIPKQNQYKKPRNQVARMILRNESFFGLVAKFTPRSILRAVRNKILLQKSEKPTMDQEARKLLENFYAEELKKFVSLLSKNAEI